MMENTERLEALINLSKTTGVPISELVEADKKLSEIHQGVDIEKVKKLYKIVKFYSSLDMYSIELDKIRYALCDMLGPKILDEIRESEKED